MSILSSTYNILTSSFNPSKTQTEEKKKFSEFSGGIVTGFFSGDGFNPSFLGRDVYTDDILKALDDCKQLSLERNPAKFVSLSLLIYNLIPLYKRAINIRSIFLGTVLIQLLKGGKNKKLKYVKKFIDEKIPIKEPGCLLPKGFGMNTFLNEICHDCDLYGIGYARNDKNPQTLEVESITIFNPMRFTFRLEENGDKNLYYGDVKVDMKDLYIYRYGNVRGYDWGTPLIYGGKFMSDNIVMLLKSHVRGMVRNMNPFDMTIISTDLKELAEMDTDGQLEVKNGIKSFTQSATKAVVSSMNGTPTHLIGNIPGISSVHNVKGSEPVTFIDPRTMNIYIELFTKGFNVEFQLLMDTTGSMNTDKFKTALIMQESWASQFTRPQMKTGIKAMCEEIFYSYGFPITDEEVSIDIMRNETLIQSILNTQTGTGTTQPTNEPQNGANM